MPYYFFPPTKIATRQIEELFDFIWPTAAALWNLRWQVNGFLQEIPEATPLQLNDRFVWGSDIHGANLRRACVETSWDDQKHNLAGVILTNAFAIYERWADEILTCVGEPADSGKALQYSDTAIKGGLQAAIKKACLKESRTIKTAFYPSYVASRKYSWPIISNLLACYRFFKEIRNDQIHRGGVAGKRAGAAYLEFAPVSTKAALGMNGALIHDPISEGDKIRLHLRGVVGFCDVLFRMIVTIDAELCRSIHAEAVLEDALRSSKHPAMLSGNPQRRQMQVVNSCKSAGLPRPLDVEAVRQFLLAKRIVAL